MKAMTLGLPLALLAAACASAGDGPRAAAERNGADRPSTAGSIDRDPFPSTYAPLPSETVALTGATVFDGTGRRLEGATVVIQEGRIAAIGSDVDVPAGARRIDASGKFVTPGIIDVHSHLGVYPSPSVPAHADGNEITDPVTAEVWAEHSVWPQDPGFSRALAGGVTALQILPGSANLVGGRAVTLKNVPSRTVQGMKFPGAPYGMKMACGENPKRVYGSRNRAPSTRMGNVAGYRAAWAKADEYRRQWDKYEAQRAGGKDDAEPPSRDLAMDTMSEVLRGDIIVHMHCYRADEMAIMIDMAKEAGYEIGTFHHAVESYKIADLLAENDICSAMWADWWGFKLEAYDGIRENIPFVHAAGACAIVHSDDELGIQRLNQEAAKARADGNAAGLDISKAEAWQWLSLNPAKSLGIADETGSLEVGKAADVVLWDDDPFSVYARAEKVYVDGALLYDRTDPRQKPVSDFELGQLGEGDRK